MLGQDERYTQVFKNKFRQFFEVQKDFDLFLKVDLKYETPPLIVTLTVPEPSDLQHLKVCFSTEHRQPKQKLSFNQQQLKKFKQHIQIIIPGQFVKSKLSFKREKTDFLWISIASTKTLKINVLIAFNPLETIQRDRVVSNQSSGLHGPIYTKRKQLELILKN